MTITEGLIGTGTEAGERPNHFMDIVDTDPRTEAIMSHVMLACFSAECIPLQEKLAADAEMLVGVGRISPADCAENILGRMGCGVKCPKTKSAL